MYRSYPVDHHDILIRHKVDAGKALHDTLKPFLARAVTPQVLRHLGDALAPAARDKVAANKVVDRVVTSLMKCPDLSVDRCCVSGSFGKKTSLVHFDIDLVVFVNEESPPFTKVIKRLEKCISTSLGATEILKTTRFSLQFLLDGFHVDLLPAQNLVDGPCRNPTETQRKNNIAKLKSLTSSNDMAFESSAFAESIVEVMKTKQPFVNAAVRLCKLWKKTCRVTENTFPTWFSSFLVEIIAADAAEKELQEHPSSASLVSVLGTFLKGLANPGVLCVVDDHQKRHIPQNVLNQRPLVMDPVNPFNNVASRIGDWTTIRAIAQTTLDALQSRNPSVGAVFAPRLGHDLPRLFRYCNFQMRFVSRGSFVRTLSVEKIRDLQGQRMNPGVEWRKPVNEALCSDKVKEYVIAMFESFVSLTTSALFSHIDDSLQTGIKEVQAVSEFLDCVLLEVCDKPKCEWVPTSRRHEDCDISLTFGQVPLPSPADDLRYVYLRLSVDVDNARFYRLTYELARDLERKAQDTEEAFY